MKKGPDSLVFLRLNAYFTLAFANTTGVLSELLAKDRNRTVWRLHAN